MKWYQFFLFLFILWSPMQAAADPFSAQTIVAEDQKVDSKKEMPLKKTEDQKEQSEKVSSTEVEEQPEPSHMQKATESYETAFIKTIVVLVGLLALVLLTVWMFKKISHGRLRTFNYMKSIKILEKRPLSPKSMLYLIEVGGKQVLVAESQFNVKAITSLDWMGTDKDL